MIGMILAQDGGKILSELANFGVPDVGIEDFFENGHLFGFDQLFILQKASLPDDRAADILLQERPQSSKNDCA